MSKGMSEGELELAEEMRQRATELYAYHKALCEAGFSRAEAMQAALAWQASIVQLSLLRSMQQDQPREDKPWEGQ